MTRVSIVITSYNVGRFLYLGHVAGRSRIQGDEAQQLH
jgi:hypothetical protein